MGEKGNFHIDKQAFACYNNKQKLVFSTKTADTTGTEEPVIFHERRTGKNKGDQMRILGIDPGYAILGYGVLDMTGNHFSVVTYGSIFTEAKMELPDRLQTLYEGLCQIIETYKPEEAAIEELFFNNNAKTAILVGEARGVAVLACAHGGLKISEYTPLQIKQALVGYGRAEKVQVQSMVKAILHLEAVPKPDDTADALAAAICHAHSSGQNRVEMALRRR